MDPILQWALGLVSTLLTAVFTGIVIPMLVKYFSAKTNNTNIQAAIADLAVTVSTSVGYINQTFVDQLKREGGFDADKSKEALEAAFNLVKNNLSKRTIEILDSDELALRDLIIRHIEAEIDKRKKQPALAT